MAVEVCSEISSTGISPRISFSHDLKNTEDASVRVEDPHRGSDLCLLDSSSDFVFCITNGLAQQLSSADELFSNGKIIPTEIKRVSNKPSQSQLATTEKIQKKRLKEFLSASSDEAENEEEKPSSKYFWQFKRSSSLNFDTTRGNGLIRSLQFLSRSNSTGSAPNPKQTELPRETHKQRLQKQSSVSSRRSSSSSSSSSTYYFYSSSQKPFLKKNGGSSGNGVRISPVLNLPQAYIPKATARFFGFGSLFCNGKSKRNKK
ncbi:hypothetical protein JHK82_056165 [Glycine max]|uniref:uncharacterized protein LOC114402576 n=1 Tax=Glycine soja TaxID=3848 RepID=UPI00054A68E8|nr:uncharacterized protein LOC114402576 [Glycine soja]KAG4907505.1 hypothetical protein JHK86_055989 [Glycine max]KAG5074810.1 hypothetical protein JHK84_056041 [Glycine max]KAG5077470.1 hypothetical protein JHK82_056165 [Glycine max]KHN11405.1 hypothetical protein glysoja_015300 [Glycine soja]